MIKSSTLLLIIIFCSSLFVSCSKELSCEGCLTGNGLRLNCQATNVEGNFYKGKALDSTNYIEILVRVENPGTYHFITDETNGVSFFASGFLAGGQQYIRLYGSGVPLESGSYKYSVNANISCSIDIQVENEPSVSAVFYYSATIDGVKYEAKALGNNGITAWAGIEASVGINFETLLKSVVGHNVWPPASGYTGMMIRKGWIRQYPSVTNLQIKDFFRPGEYFYVDPNWALIPPYNNGITVTWYDLNGQIWYSDSSGDPTVNSFKITSCFDGPAVPSPGYFVSFTAEFKCKLFNSAGQMKSLTDGKFYGFAGRY